MGGVRDYCGNYGMQRETGVAPPTGARGGGRGAKNFLHRNAGKMTAIEAKPGNLYAKPAKHHARPRA